ncbi:hypothetical protein IJ076_01540 [Candidatus Saccharibacteria bacterium]|nr:hypothetical protein [Candidatus Saccharibacteria bacterium]
MEKTVLSDKVRAKEEYLERKRRLLQIEKNNYSKVYVIRSFDGWYKIFGNSALILSRYLMHRVGRQYKLHKDNDYMVRDKIGSISIPENSVGELKMRMESAKLRLAREWEKGLEFELGETISKEDMAQMLHEDEILTEKANQLVVPHAIMPELKMRVVEMVRVVHEVTSNQKALSKIAFLSDMERNAVDIDMMTVALGRRKIEIDTCLEMILEKLETMYEYVTVMSDLEMMTPKKYWEVLKKIRDVESQIMREMKKQAIKKVEKEHEKGKGQNAKSRGKKKESSESKELSNSDERLSSAEEKETE